MFDILIKHLFSKNKNANQANYFYYEESKNKTKDEQHVAIEQIQSTLNTRPVNIVDEQQHQIAFYDYLFGQSPPTKQHDELSIYVANEIEQLLLHPKAILEALPVLPPSLSQVLNQLGKEDFDTELIIKLIELEPIIAAKVIELANSSYYNRSEKEVTNLKAAFMMLGVDGLIAGVINGFINKLTPQSQAYFSQYGSKIWQHSLACGLIAKQLINDSPYKDDAAKGYLIGLICNLGDMIIYQLLIEAFSYVHPDCQPNSFAFKELMMKNSKKLTYFIIKYWQFPESIITTLGLQTKITHSSMLNVLYPKEPMTCFIYEANILSSLDMLFEHKKIDTQYLNKAKECLVYSEQAKHYIDRLLSV